MACHAETCKLPGEITFLCSSCLEMKNCCSNHHQFKNTLELNCFLDGCCVKCRSSYECYDAELMFLNFMDINKVATFSACDYCILSEAKPSIADHIEANGVKYISDYSETDSMCTICTKKIDERKGWQWNNLQLPEPIAICFHCIADSMRRYTQ